MVALQKSEKRYCGVKEDTMNLKHLFVAVPAGLLFLGNGVANAGKTINESGAIACISSLV
jgi:hypothetical protein